MFGQGGENQQKTNILKFMVAGGSGKDQILSTDLKIAGRPGRENCSKELNRKSKERNRKGGRWMRFKSIPFICIFLLFLSSLAVAQEVGNFVGTVQDSEGNALPGATVTAKNTNTGLTQSTITNAQGRYRIERIIRGTYNLSASLQGFKTLIKEGIILYAGGENKIDFSLEIGKLEEEITVVGETPMVETTKSQVSTVMTEKEILSYPQANRNFLNLMAYAPGTLPNAPTIGGVGYAVNGMRGESNNFMLDGINNNDMTDNSQYVGVALLPPEAIQEFRLVSNNFNVESARNTGGQLNVVMKSGTNEFHGSAWLFYRGKSALFRSEDWLTHELPDYSRQQYGATLGGPIIKDKTFFFGSFEGVKEKNATVRNPYLFTAEARAAAVGVARFTFDHFGSKYPLPTYGFLDVDGDGVPDYGRGNFTTSDDLTAYTGSLKIDHIFGPKDRIAFRWLLNYQTNKQGWPYYWVPGTQLERPRDTHTGGLSWLHLFSPTAYNEVRVGYHREYWEEKIQDRDQPQWVFYDEVQSFGDSGYPMYQNNQTYQITDVLNFQAGNHSIKVGGELRYWRVHCMFDANVWGYYSYYTGMEWVRGTSPASLGIGCDPPDPPAGNPYVVGSLAGDWKTGLDMTWRKWSGIEGGLFVQDDWRVSNRLTVSLGVRWDYYSVPQENSGAGQNQPAFGTRQGYETGQVIEGKNTPEGIRYTIFKGRDLLGKGIWNPYYGCFSPKVSFAYDLTGDGKTSIRGGYGIGYERQMNRNWENDRFNYPAFAFAAFYGSPSGDYPDIEPTIPGSIPPLANREGSRVSLRWMDPDLKPQMAHNWMLGMQRELAPNVSLEINYAGSAGRRIGSLTNINRFTGDRVDGVENGINPYISIRSVYMRENKWTSNYHSLQVILNKRFSNGWSWYTAYTYGHSKDYVSAYQWGPLSSIEREDIDYGNSDYDYRHRAVGGFVYELPFFKQSKNWLVKNVLAGWQIAGSWAVTSGQPYSPFASGTSSTDYNKDCTRWDYPLWLGSGNNDAVQWDNGYPSLDKTQFGVPIPPALGYYDEASMKIVNDLSYYNQNFVKRNMFHWFSTNNIDVALQKYFTIPVGGREITLQFIAEVFNLMKSRIWGYASDQNLPDLNMRYYNSTFGTVTRMNGDRTAQVSLRVMF